LKLFNLTEYNREGTIIFDSGCTSHMTGDINLFDVIYECIGDIELPDKGLLKYLGKGKIGLLEDVLWVPGIKGTYISEGKLDKQGYEIKKKNGKLLVINDDDDIILKGKLSSNLYHLVDDDEHLLSINVKEGSAPTTFKTSVGNMNNLDYLHHRMGHPNIEVIKQGIRKGSINGTYLTWNDVKEQELSFCPDCLRGKMTDNSIKNIEDESSKMGPMELLATDSKGPLSMASWIKKYKYFDLYIFGSSKWIEVRFKTDKKETYNNLSDIINQVKKYGHQLKYLMTDDDVLYKDSKVKELLDNESIIKRTSVPYKHASNGFVERSIRTIMEKARTIMLIYNCPLKFWPEAIQTAVYLFNVTPIKSLNWETPYQRIFNKVPDISNLKPFYAPGMVYLSKEERQHSLSEKTLECRLLGYDKESKNGYIVWIPTLQKVKRTVNVRFKEEIDLSKTSEDDELRDLGRFKDLTLNENELTIKDQEDFFDGKVDYDHLYWHEEDDWKDISEIRGDFLKEQEESSEINSDDEELVEKLQRIDTYLGGLQEEITLPPIPKNIIEAYESENSEKWLNAINEELKQLYEAGAYKVTTVQNGEKVAKMRLLFKASLDNEFKVKFKARLVLCGYSQIYGINYLATYAPTISRDTLRMILIYLLKHNMLIEIYDVKGAFIEGINDYRVLGEMPKELFPNGSAPVIVEWIRSLYGEKQAAYIWYLRLKEILCDKMGFTVSVQDEALFY
jgi:hypothetical protein